MRNQRSFLSNNVVIAHHHYLIDRGIFLIEQFLQPQKSMNGNFHILNFIQFYRIYRHFPVPAKSVTTREILLRELNCVFVLYLFV